MKPLAHCFGRPDMQRCKPIERRGIVDMENGAHFGQVIDLQLDRKSVV